MPESVFTTAFIIALLQATLRTTAPLLFASMGGLFSERSGVLCIGMEGFMLVGAFAGFVGTYYTGNLFVGLLTALLAGALLSLVYAYLTVTIGGSQAVVGTACVLFAAGATGFLIRSLFGLGGEFPSIPTFNNIPLPGLSRLPYIGPIFFEHNILVYLCFFLVPLTWFILYRTALGLEIRSVGEHPKAADTVGLNVSLIRYACILISGALGGIGGAYLSLAHANTFIEMMTAEKGYIAFAIVIFGKYNPLGAFCAALLFGFAEALQLRLQAAGVNIPYQYLLMLPYVLTLIGMIGAGRTVAPAALGKAYTKN